MKKYLVCHTDGFIDEFQFCSIESVYEIVDEFEVEDKICYAIIDDEGDEHHFNEHRLNEWFELVIVNE